jgi:hypothetical protein
MTAQDPPNRGRVESQFRGEHHRPPLAAAAGGQHPLLDPRRGPVRHPDRPRGTIRKPGITSFSMAAQPLVNLCSRHPELLGDMRRRPARSDTLNNQTTSEQIRAGVSVSHKMTSCE